MPQHNNQSDYLQVINIIQEFIKMLKTRIELLNRCQATFDADAPNIYLMFEFIQRPLSSKENGESISSHLNKRRRQDNSQTVSDQQALISDTKLMLLKFIAQTKALIERASLSLETLIATQQSSLKDATIDSLSDFICNMKLIDSEILFPQFNDLIHRAQSLYVCHKEQQLQSQLHSHDTQNFFTPCDVVISSLQPYISEVQKEVEKQCLRCLQLKKTNPPAFNFFEQARNDYQEAMSILFTFDKEAQKSADWNIFFNQLFRITPKIINKEEFANKENFFINSSFSARTEYAKARIELSNVLIDLNQYKNNQATPNVTCHKNNHF